MSKICTICIIQHAMQRCLPSKPGNTMFFLKTGPPVVHAHMWALKLLFRVFIHNYVHVHVHVHILSELSLTYLHVRMPCCIEVCPYDIQQKYVPYFLE